MKSLPCIKTENLWHIYPGEVVALRGIDLEIRHGELIGLIGQNGSGKTTLVKHFNGLLKPTRGRVLIDGLDVKDQPVSSLSRKVGYLFQNPDHQIFCSTVWEEISFGPRILGWPKEEIERAVEDSLKVVGLEGYRDTPPSILNLGERRKVTFASILVMRPKIMILDEPTTGVDWADSLDVMDIVKDLNARGHTIIVITHNMRLISEYAKRVVVLCEGKVLMDDTTEEVFSRPDILRETFLSPPQITQLAQRLENYGMPPNVLTVREFYDKFISRVGGQLNGDGL